MAVIGMIGPHAIGKTTAVYRWLDRYQGKLLGVIADDQWEAVSRTEKERVRAWKGTKEEKQERMRFHQEREGITLIDSARSFSSWMSLIRPTDPVIILTCPEAYGRQCLLERRQKNNNPKPLSDYWTVKRLDYECNGHLLGWKKRLLPTQVKHFVVTDREKDWPVIDEYFYSLFRRLHNAQNKGHR